MKKLYLLLLLPAFLFLACSDDEDKDPSVGNDDNYIELAIFEDSYFRKYCTTNFDKNKDGKLSPKEIDDVVNIDISKINGVQTLKGIEVFKNLESLVCDENYYIETIDLSPHTKLKHFRGSHLNALTIFNISKNISLETLDLSWLNKLNNIDLSNNINIKTLKIEVASFRQLDISKLVKLEVLSCENNDLGSIDISHNKELINFNCKDNMITTINLDQNTKLKELNCSFNKIGEVLIIRNNRQLEKLICDPNDNLKHLFVWKGFDKSTFKTFAIPTQTQLIEG